MAEKIVVKYKGDPAPVYQTVGAAGCDVASSIDVTIEPGNWCAVPTGLSLEIPQGFEAQVRSRSGLALKYGVCVLNSPGTIDSDYRGELKVILANTGKQQFIVKKGDRIAQVVFSPVIQATFESTSELSETDRASNGFGSTGV